MKNRLKRITNPLVRNAGNHRLWPIATYDNNLLRPKLINSFSPADRFTHIKVYPSIYNRELHLFTDMTYGVIQQVRWTDEKRYFIRPVPFIDFTQRQLEKEEYWELLRAIKLIGAAIPEQEEMETDEEDHDFEW